MPETLTLDGAEYVLRPMTGDDADALLAFARALPPHDLLFVARDITQPAVVEAWIAQNGEGSITTLIAEDDGEIAGCAALVRDPLSWSPHLGEVRVLVAEGARAHGLGRRLIEAMVQTALDTGLAKLTARMTPDQKAAITVFEELGFSGEALLKDHVRDAGGDMHDIVILACDVNRVAAQIEAMGIGEAG